MPTVQGCSTAGGPGGEGEEGSDGSYPTFRFQLNLLKDAVLNPPQPNSDPTSLISFHKTYQGL